MMCVRVQGVELKLRPKESALLFKVEEKLFEPGSGAFFLKKW